MIWGYIWIALSATDELGKKKDANIFEQKQNR